jgi:glyoxylase-like metal-dependent hydrolase (beta-lactamase superfamily II)
MEHPKVIDAKMHGRDGITGVFLVQGELTALVESGPASSLAAVIAGLDEAGIDHLDWVIVTHIHLDHAGAAGNLAQRFPDAKIAVHEVGAPHLVDPAKLWASASRIYGDQMDELWGGMEPIPEDRITALVDGDTIDLGGRTLRAIDTPGHARHHHAYLDDATGIVFTGDALGVRLPDVGIVRPATPPPEFDLTTAIASIERIRELGPTELWLTHFGSSATGTRPSSVDETCDDAIEALKRWAEWIAEARDSSRDIDEVTGIVVEKAESSMRGLADDAAIDRMEQTTSYRMNTSGYMRYFDKKEQAAG